MGIRLFANVGYYQDAAVNFHVHMPFPHVIRIDLTKDFNLMTQPGYSQWVQHEKRYT